MIQSISAIILSIDKTQLTEIANLTESFYRIKTIDSTVSGLQPVLVPVIARAIA
jgi:hypothetical protein